MSADALQPPAAPASSWWSQLERRPERTLLWLSALLFLVTAVPLGLVDSLPYQDLGNHYASVHILWHPERYPEFQGNGFFKTNSALFAWLYVAGKPLGLDLASKLFAWLILACNALLIPRFVHQLTGSWRRALLASLCAIPMIGNWWLLMGMLDYALALPLTLELMLLCVRQWRAPSAARGLGMAVLCGVLWYTHCFALMVAGLLLLLELARVDAFDGEARPLGARLKRFGARVLAPLLPGAALTLHSLGVQLTEPAGAMSGEVRLERDLPTWEALYHFWAEYGCGLSSRGLGSAAALVALPLAWPQRRERWPLFAPRAMLLLFACCLLVPYSAGNWFHVSSRFIPFFWFGVWLRLPERAPRALLGGLVLALGSFLVATGFDYRKLAADRAEFRAGIDAVPDGAKLMPLLYRAKSPGEHTQSLLHAWGDYVVAKNTSAPLLFAHSRSFPVMYRTPPPPRFNHLVLESFPRATRSLRRFCERSRDNQLLVRDACGEEYAETVREFFDDARTQFDHVLLWDASELVLEQLPPYFEPVFAQGRLRIFRIDR